VRVAIDQSRKHREICKIDGSDAGRQLLIDVSSLAYGFDLAILNPDELIGCARREICLRGRQRTRVRWVLVAESALR